MFGSVLCGWFWSAWVGSKMAGKEDTSFVTLQVKEDCVGSWIMNGFLLQRKVFLYFDPQAGQQEKGVSENRSKTNSNERENKRFKVKEQKFEDFS